MKTKVVDVPELHWPFHGEAYAQAGQQVRVDPFPGYAHDIKLVRRTLRAVESAAGLTIVPDALYVLHHEPLERTNGWAAMDTAWDEERGAWAVGPGGWIVLAGKRVPPHPGVTRYLVAHEYGHHAEYDITARRELDPDSTEVKREYAALRGRDFDEGQRYGGRLWHSNTGELIANDFRILVAGVEPDFWPHPGIPRPERVKGLKRWWEEALS